MLGALRGDHHTRQVAAVRLEPERPGYRRRAARL
jgi:hypothetical protein